MQAYELFLLVTLALTVSSIVPIAMETFVREEGGSIVASVNYSRNGHCNEVPTVPYFSMASASFCIYSE